MRECAFARMCDCENARVRGRMSAITRECENPRVRKYPSARNDTTLEYYLGGFCSFGPKKRQKNRLRIVSSSIKFLGGMLGVRGSIPGLAKMFISLFEFFSLLKCDLLCE